MIAFINMFTLYIIEASISQKSLFVNLFKCYYDHLFRRQKDDKNPVSASMYNELTFFATV